MTLAATVLPAVQVPAALSQFCCSVYIWFDAVYMEPASSQPVTMPSAALNSKSERAQKRLEKAFVQAVHAG